MNAKQRQDSPYRFWILNGILTVSTSGLIFTAIFLTLHAKGIGWKEPASAFLFVLAVMTIFFFLTFRQGEKLRAEQERMVHVFEHMTDGLVILDDRLQVVQTNPAAGRLIGLSEGSLPLNFCGICSNYPGVGKMCVYDMCFISEKEGVPVEMTIRPNGGGEGQVSIATSSYRDLEGKLWHILRIREINDDRRNDRERVAKMITHSIMQAQEKERKRISRELHDGIGQALYGALIQMDIIVSMLDEEEPAVERIENLQNNIRHLIEEIRHLSAELRPSVLDDIGLVAALRNYVQDFGQKFGLQINFSYEGDKSRLPAAVETALYRIAQEALTNAAKYAGADRVDVMLVQAKSSVSLTVKDYGTGFVTDKDSPRGVGLYSMEERAGILNGQFRLQSSLGKGTSIHVELPLEEEEKQLGNSGFVSG